MKTFKSLIIAKLALPAICLLTGLGSAVFAQENYTPNLLPPAPEAAALGKYVEVPVSPYTGVPQINVPLTEVQQGSISVPVYLSYHASGNKVEDITPYTGLGWTLNAGGVITRVVRGLPDDHPNIGFLSFIQENDGDYDYLTSGDPDSYVPLDMISKRCRDAEPDQYYFNFNGYTGTFSFDWDGQLIVDSDKKINVNYELDGNGKISSWEVILDDGTICSFDLPDLTQIQNYDISCVAVQRYASSWYLTEIADVNGQNNVFFEYENYPFSYFHKHSEGRSYLMSYNNNACQGPASGTPISAVTTMSFDGKRIRRIHTGSGNEVLFVASNTRTDLNDINLYQTPLASLDTILVKNNLGATIRSFAMGYDYSTDRLTLKSVTEFNGLEAKPPYTFDYNPTRLPAYDSKKKDHWGFYNHNPHPNTEIPSGWVDLGNGLVNYVEGADRSPAENRMKAGILEKMTLPTGGFTRFEYEAHEYGYVRDREIQEFEIEKKAVQVLSLGECPFAANCNGDQDTKTMNIVSSELEVEVTVKINLRSADLIPGSFGEPYVLLEDNNGTILTRYDEASDGQTVTYKRFMEPGEYVVTSFAKWHFDNEPPDAASGIFEWEEETDIPVMKKTAGGLRIKRVKEYAFENDPNAIIRKYEYLMPDGRSSGVLNGEPRYDYQYISYQSEIPCTSYYRVAQNTISFGTTQGSHIGYREVAVYYGDNGENGKTDYRFFSLYESPDDVSYEPPFPPATSYNYKTGLLKDRTDYKKEGAHYLPVKTQRLSYHYREQAVNALKVGFRGGNSSSAQLHKYDMGEYRLIMGHHQIAQLQEELYSMTDGQAPYIKTVNYTYDTEYQNLLRQEQSKSDGTEQIIEYYYTDDYSNITDPNHFIAQMSDRNMRGIPVETIIKNKNGATEEVLTADYSSYAVTNGSIYPLAKRLLETNRPLSDFDYSFDNPNGSTDSRYGEEVIRYEAYDAAGNPIQYTDRTGITTAMQWGYELELPVAQAINAQADQIYFEGFEEDSQAMEDAANARSGYKYLNSGSYVLSFTPPTDGQTYLMSYWFYDGSWQLVQDIPFQNTISSTGSRIDDIRVYPEGAQMISFTHQPGVGTTSQTDANNRTVFYEYDDLGRLLVLRDHKGNILKTYAYRYAN